MISLHAISVMMSVMVAFPMSPSPTWRHLHPSTPPPPLTPVIIVEMHDFSRNCSSTTTALTFSEVQVQFRTVLYIIPSSVRQITLRHPPQHLSNDRNVTANGDDSDHKFTWEDLPPTAVPMLVKGSKSILRLWKEKRDSIYRDILMRAKTTATFVQNVASLPQWESELRQHMELMESPFLVILLLK